MTAGRRSRRASPWALWIYLALTIGCLAAGLAATQRIRQLEGSAGYLEGQLRSQAQDYASTLQGRFADDEMASLQERRALLAASASWWQLRLACLMAWVLASFAFYIQRSIAKLTEELTDL